MAKAKLRRIVVDENRYLWAVQARYVPEDAFHPQCCAQVKFTAFLEGQKSTPLIIHFVTWEDAIAGNPLTTGFGEINLNQPSLAKVLILAEVADGWNGNRASKTIAEGKPFLKEAGYDTSKI